ncbi:MAG TPA: polysaccharide biosynthesis tyrosine autokinase [Pyrinomonadaceae bacterium]
MKQLDENQKNTEIGPYNPGYPAEPTEFYSESYYGAAEPQGSEKLMLRNFLATLRKHLILIVAITVVVTAASILYVAQKPDYYTSRARVQVNAENNVLPTGGGSGSGPIIISNAANDPTYFTTQLQVLEGSGLLMRVAKNLDLANNPTFRNAYGGRRATAWQNIKKLVGAGDDPKPAAAESTPGEKSPALELTSNDPATAELDRDKYIPLANAIKQNLVVTPVKDNRTIVRDTRLIEIAYTHGDPALAAKIVNAIADTYVLQNLELKVRTHASAGDFLQKRVAELQASIRSGEERLVNYSRDKQIVSPDATQNTVVQRLGALNSQVGQAENDRIAAQTAYQAAYQNVMRNAIAEGADPQVVALDGQLTGLKQKLAQLKTEYTDEWWEVVQVRKQIENVENQLGQLRRRANDVQLARLKERLDEATDREQKLKAVFTQQREEVIRQNEASINYKIIQQEVDTNKTLLASLLQRSRENDVILNDTPNNVLVSERAATPLIPAGPERSQTILIAFFTSLLVGCGLALFLGWIDDSIHYAEDFEESVGIPLLAAIPATAGGIVGRFGFQKLFPGRAKRARHERYDLALFERPEIAESYIQMRTHLMLSRAGGPPKSILVTSGEEREGKTVTALNLALRLSEANKKVLLIDADLRCPRIDAIKRIPNKVGLTTLLAADTLKDELIDEAIQVDPTSDIHILTAGEHSVNPTNLLASEQMTWLLQRLSRRYDHIVVDSPPALYFADSTIISTIVDSVIIVVRDGLSSTASLLKLQRLFQSVGAKVVGMVVNAVPWNKHVYSRYSYYHDAGQQFAEEQSLQPLNLG